MVIASCVKVVIMPKSFTVTVHEAWTKTYRVTTDEDVDSPFDTSNVEWTELDATEDFFDVEDWEADE